MEHRETPDEDEPIWVRVLGSDPKAIALPPTESPFLDQLLDNIPTGEHHALIRKFADDGYVVLDLELDDFDARADRIVADLVPHYPDSGNRRVPEAWYFNEDVRALATCSQILDVLRVLYAREPIPFQTLNFEHGSEQRTHSDAIHFFTQPRRYMCGVWIAFEDVDEGNGPVHYYPGSHKLPEFDMHDLGRAADMAQYDNYEHFVDALMRAKGFERKELCIRRGQVMIWSANLHHGGSPIRDVGRTRTSQVTHYYFDECVYWFPAESDSIIGQPCLREVIDLRTGKFVPHRHHGTTIDINDFERVWRYPRPLPDFVKKANSAT